MINITGRFLNILGFKRFLFHSAKLAALEVTIKQLEETIENQNNLLANISHEIRTPMHGICNISEFLNDSWQALDEDQKKTQIQSITEISSWLKNFINSLLDISKFQAGRMTFEFAEVDLLPLIQDAITHSLKSQLFNKSRLKIVLDNPKYSQAILKADAFRIAQLLRNLFDNAIKYTHEGTITAVVTKIIFNKQAAWQFDLRDEGIGIPEHELKIIFDSFTKSSNKLSIAHNTSTGLGLYICREIVAAHGGYLWANNNGSKNSVGRNINKSADVKGATFSFILPINNF